MTLDKEPAGGTMTPKPAKTRLRRPFFAVLMAMALLPAPAPAQTPAPQPPVAGVPAAPPAATAPAATPVATPAPAIAVALPRDLSPWGMFMNADIVVKAVMLGLAFASVLSWTIWLAKTLELVAARARLRRGLRVLSDTRSLADALEQLARVGGDALTLAQAADRELQLSADALVADGVKERVASRLSRIEAAGGRRMIRGTGWLATIGATAPFVGLFGTVWGIMNSFIGISKQHTTNLAVVAPGIAEALLATALGLVAAIPAVVMYNMFSRWTAGYRAQAADAAAAVLRLVSRDLDRGVSAQPSAERRHAAE